MKVIWFDEDVYKLLVRLFINVVFITIIVRFFYFKITKRKDYLFTYYLMSFIIFFICFSLKKLDIDTGMGLGLFAIFGIVRYRTSQIDIKEMSYLFVVIGLSVINALSSTKISMVELGVINIFTVLLIYVLEFVWLLKHETRKTVLFDNINLIKTYREADLKNELEARTGININRVEIGRINYLNDTAQVRIFYYDDEQGLSDYNENDL